MHLFFDHHHLLCVEHPHIPSIKEYRFSLAGKPISSPDKGALVYHKRQRKLIHLKNLGDGMQLCYLQKTPLPDYELNIAMLEKTLAMFSGFNEETGEKYRFLPFYSKEIKRLQQELSDHFGISCHISKEQQGTFIRGLQKDWSAPESDEELVSYLFALVFLYGKFEIKNQELIAAKAHIPLFGAWNQLANDFFEKFLPRLQALGLFITVSTLQQGGKNTLQLSINDSELLDCFAKWLHQYQKAELSLE